MVQALLLTLQAIKKNVCLLNRQSIEHPFIIRVRTELVFLQGHQQPGTCHLIKTSILATITIIINPGSLLNSQIINKLSR